MRFRPRRRKGVEPTPRRTVTCRLCRRPVEVDVGLQGMADHWEAEHPEALKKMRARFDDAPNKLPNEEE